MPIENNRKLGFHYTSRPRVLPRMNVSEKELITLCAALQSIERHRGTIFEEGLTEFYHKLCQQFDDDTVRLFEETREFLTFQTPGYHVEIDAEVFQTVLLALREQRVLALEYYSLKKKRWKKRELRPLRVVCDDPGWYLRAYNAEHKAVLTYSLARMRDAGLLRSTFDRRDYAELEAEGWRNGMGAFGGGPADRVVMRFSPAFAPIAREMRWQWEHECIERPDNSLDLTLHVAHTIDLEGFLLARGAHVEVLEPPSLRQAIKRLTQQMAAIYAGE